MDRNELKIEAIKNGISSLSQLADCVGIPRKRFFSHLKTGNFTRDEIVAIAKRLSLSADRVIAIFFAEKVS